MISYSKKGHTFKEPGGCIYYLNHWTLDFDLDLDVPSIVLV
jgi:hypothetical protein